MISAFRIRFAGSFNPLSLLPALWLDASDGSTLFDATTGGSLPADGGLVARWEDKSGNARHATQATSGSRPTRVVAGKNGRDVLNFDGSADFMATVAFGGSQTWTRWVVFVSQASQYKIICAHASAFDSPNGADYLATNLQRLETTQNGSSGTSLLSSKTASANNTPTGTYVLASQSCDGTNAGQTPRLNGATFASTNSFANNPGTFTKASTAYGIGATNSGVSPTNCRIAEVFHVPGVVTTENREAMDRYLISKWAL